jgi:hypothetical protein
VYHEPEPWDEAFYLEKSKWTKKKLLVASISLFYKRFSIATLDIGVILTLALLAIFYPGALTDLLSYLQSEQ